jgi:hypothetical protein
MRNQRERAKYGHALKRKGLPKPWLLGSPFSCADRPISRVLYGSPWVPRQSSILAVRYRTAPAAYPALEVGEQPTAPKGSRLLGLAPGGGCLAADITASAGGLLHHLFTLTTIVAVCFCGPIRGISPPGCYPAPCSLERGLSSGGCLRLPGRSCNCLHLIAAGEHRQRNAC